MQIKFTHKLHSHTVGHSHSPTVTHSHRQTVTESHSHRVTESHSSTFTWSHRYTDTQSNCLTVCLTVTQSHSHTDMLYRMLWHRRRFDLPGSITDPYVNIPSAAQPVL